MNPILDTDSYKLSHPPLYADGISGMSAYIEARKPDELITFFGPQMWLMKQRQVTAEHVAEARIFSKEHGEPFNPLPWAKVVDEYDGWLPIKIWAVPEGLRVPSQCPLVRVECEDPDLFWLAMHVETSLQRAVWYPCSVASNDYKARRMLSRYALETSDNPASVDFMLHDFGGRGVSSEESAQVAGAAHLVYFNGSDTISGVRAANRYYNCSMSAFSVPASEHSVQCSHGRMAQLDYLKRVLDTYAKPGAIVSIVIDGYDTFREAETLCSALRDQIGASGARVVFRPDSGDAVQNVLRILRMQEAAFGSKRNSKGFKVVNNAGVIQGDGVDLESMERILDVVTANRYATDNVVFGSGGALLQKVNRDTYGFAQKASAIKQYGEWRGIKKDTPGKVSKSGRMTTLRSKMNGDFMPGAIIEGIGFAEEWEDQLQLVWDTGKLLVRHTLDEVRKRARS